MSSYLPIKKDQYIVFFYVFYFTWLLTITFLSTNNYYNNLFSIFVIVFYLIFLREKLDFTIFVIITIIAVFYHNISFVYDMNNISYWLPLSWSGTALALRKFFLLTVRRAI